MEMPLPPDDQELRNVIDKLAQFVARNGPEFEKMTMEKQKDNPKFSFLFGGEFYSYYKCKLALEQQQLICKQQAPELEPTSAMPPLPQPPLAPTASLTPAQGTPSMDELIQQSQWSLQQQEQHLLALRQEQVTTAVAHAVEQQMQKLLEETQLDMSEFDNLLQPIIDTCTKDAISAGKNWMFSNAKSPPHCELMAGHLRNRITADGAHFELRLHLIYLINDVLHHCQRKQARELLAALQKVVVPIYCTSFLAVEEDKQQKIARLLQLWEKNGYFDDSIIQQLQSPALGLGQYQATLINEYSSVVQPVQLAFQQQIQSLKTQHEEFVSSLAQQQQQQQQQQQPPPQPQPPPQQPQPQQQQAPTQGPSNVGGAPPLHTPSPDGCTTPGGKQAGAEVYGPPTGMAMHPPPLQHGGYHPHQHHPHSHPAQQPPQQQAQSQAPINSTGFAFPPDWCSNIDSLKESFKMVNRLNWSSIEQSQFSELMESLRQAEQRNWTLDQHHIANLCDSLNHFLTQTGHMPPQGGSHRPPAPSRITDSCALTSGKPEPSMNQVNSYGHPQASHLYPGPAPMYPISTQDSAGYSRPTHHMVPRPPVPPPGANEEITDDFDWDLIT